MRKARECSAAVLDKASSSALGPPPSALVLEAGLIGALETPALHPRPQVARLPSGAFCRRAEPVSGRQARLRRGSGRRQASARRTTMSGEETSTGQWQEALRTIVITFCGGCQPPMSSHRVGRGRQHAGRRRPSGAAMLGGARPRCPRSPRRVPVARASPGPTLTWPVQGVRDGDAGRLLLSRRADQTSRGRPRRTAAPAAAAVPSLRWHPLTVPVQHASVWTCQAAGRSRVTPAPPPAAHSQCS